MDSLTLSNEEIYQITHYKLPKKQLAALEELGIPAKLRRIDNTVCVLRAHLNNLVITPAPAANRGPIRKSARQ
jgi:hypothetical protein